MPTPAGDPLAAEYPKPDDASSQSAVEYASGELWCDTMGWCRSCCQAGLVVGVEGVFLAPIGEPSRTVTLTDLTTEEVYHGDAHPSLGSGVRTWIGLQRDCWGFRFRYTHFGNREFDPQPRMPLNAEPTFAQGFFLEADTIDIELTQAVCFAGWDVDASFGGRWARLERNATVVGWGEIGNGVSLTGVAMGANEIEGAGMTFSLGGRKPIPCTHWNLYCAYRGSLLWGDSSASALTEATAITVSPAAAANSRDEAFASSDSQYMFLSEVQLGLQYERCLACLPTTFFFRAGMEYQHWNTGEVGAETSSFAFLEGVDPAFGGRVDAASVAHDGDLDMIGFVVGAGLTY